MAAEPDVARAVADAARTMNEPESLDDVLQVIAQVARLSVPEFDQVGITVVDRKGAVQTRAAAGDLVPVLDALQYQLGEGPCVDALKEELVLAPHLGADGRWPRYVPEAVSLGVRAQMAARLHTDDTALGSLNFYSTTTDEISLEAQSQTDLFAAHAAIALARARERHNLKLALETRTLIGQAIGIVMERFGIDEHRAFDFLLRSSSHANTKLREIAQAIVDDRNAPH